MGGDSIGRTDPPPLRGSGSQQTLQKPYDTTKTLQQKPYKKTKKPYKNKSSTKTDKNPTYNLQKSYKTLQNPTKTLQNPTNPDKKLAVPETG